MVIPEIPYEFWDSSCHWLRAHLFSNELWLDHVIKTEKKARGIGGRKHLYHQEDQNTSSLLAGLRQVPKPNNYHLLNGYQVVALCFILVLISAPLAIVTHGHVLCRLGHWGLVRLNSSPESSCIKWHNWYSNPSLFDLKTHALNQVCCWKCPYCRICILHSFMSSELCHTSGHSNVSLL